MDERSRLIYLADIYGGLLTEKQQDILNSYLNEDITISEIARSENISRQAAFDLVRRSEKLLENYDAKLGLFDRYLENRRMIEDLMELTEGDGKCLRLLEKLMENI